MLFVRRFLYHFVSSLLFVLLIATAWSTTATVTFSHPNKLEGWLSQSGLYDYFVATAIQQTQKSSTNGQGSGGNNSDVSLSDPHVQQAVQSAFTPQTIQNAVDTFLNGNYAWLEGKTTTPNFQIDLSSAKSAMASNLAAYAQNRAASLPRCTTMQLLQIQNSGQSFDALNATCLPPGVTPAQAAQTVQQQAATSQDFLPDPVITPQNLQITSTQSSQTGQPYYQKLSFLPASYRWATRLPWMLTVLSLLCGIGVVFLAATRRKGLRRLGALLVAAGTIILLLIIASNYGVHRLENKTLNSSDLANLRQSIVDFIHRVQSGLVHTDLWFGIGFILAGLIIFLVLALTRQKKQAIPKAPSGPTESLGSSVLNTDSTSVPETQAQPPKPAKRPVLVQ